MTPEEIKAARVKLKCTAKELAATLDVTPATIGGWERGELFPTKQYVEAIAKLVEQGPTSVPKKAKGADPMDALRDPEVWTLVRKLLAHPKLRAEVSKLADKYDEP
ncbi:MAG: helix-turn-helix domain-containing protein [Polyangiales bacterium]